MALQDLADAADPTRIHALAGWIGIFCLILHFYTAVWTKGAIRAMIRGTVTKS